MNTETPSAIALPRLNTLNPEAVTYQTEELLLTVLGGVRIEGLDRMRVTLKIEVHTRKFQHYLNNPEIAALAIRHNLDLYNDVQVEKLIRKTAERLEVGSSAVAKAIAALTSELENYRLSQLEQQKKKAGTRKPLTEAERSEAIAFLSAPQLMERTGEMIGHSGVIGEELNRLLMYVIFTSRKREHPLHVVSLGSSGTGKTYLQEKVAELIPEEDKIEITTLSDNAFYYFEKNELSNKLILIEDFDGALGVLYPLRELQSKKRITKTVTFKDSRGNTKTVHLTVEGPVCVAGCTTKASIYEDNANRSFLIYLDETAEQDERIMDYQRAASAGRTNEPEQQRIKTLMKNCQRVLQPVAVRNPFAEFLKIPAEVFKPRRTNAHYLQFIEAVTFYHQYQREQKTDQDSGEIFIETTLEDIAVANGLLKEILLRKSDALTGACRNYFEQLKAHLKALQQNTFTNKSVSWELRLPLSTVKRHHLELSNAGFLRQQEHKEKKNAPKGFLYEVVSYEEYQALQQKVVSVLDEILQQLTGSLPAQSPTEPLQPLPAKRRGRKPKSSAEESAAQNQSSTIPAAL